MGARPADELDRQRRWTNPSAIRALVASLETLHGVPEPPRARDPLETLIACILSQHTSDSNSGRAYERLRARFATWDDVRLGELDSIAGAIRVGGLAATKSRVIRAVLAEVLMREGTYSIDRLRRLPDPEARAYLMSLPGVGPKTAAIVLCFAMHRPVLPVDTHVFRVSWRLGMIERRSGEAQAHDALQRLVPDDLVYRFHLGMVAHGRGVCAAQRPRCETCPLTQMCMHSQP